jgi:hypothetical protein
MGRRANLPATNVEQEKPPNLPSVSRSSKRVDNLPTQLSVEPPPLVADLHTVPLDPNNPYPFSLKIQQDTLSFISITITGHWENSSSSTAILTIKLEVDAQAHGGRFKEFQFSIKFDNVHGEQSHVGLQSFI